MSHPQHDPTQPNYHVGQPPQPPRHQPPPPQVQHIVQTQPGTDSSKKFLNLSLTALISIIATILLVCCIGPILLCAFTPILGAVVGDPPVTQPPPTATITSCKIDDSGGVATIGIRVTNNGTEDEGYTVRLIVKDATGAKVGDGSEYVSSVPAGSSAVEDATVFLDAKGGKTCSVSSVD